MYCSVNGSVCLVCLTGFVNCLVKQFAICLSVVVILLLNVLEVYSVGGGSKECACCACTTSVHLSVPSIGFCLCLIISEVISSFMSLRAGSHLFCSLHAISLYDLANYMVE